MKCVTLAMPTHNRSALLGQTLESLRSLRVPAGVDVRLVVVADACTDDTKALAVEGFKELPFAAQLEEVEYRNLNRGRNRCVELATGDVVIFLDDDVWADPGLLEGHLEVFETTPASITAGQIELWWRDVTRPPCMSDGTAKLLTERRFDAGPPCRLTRPWDAAGANFAIRRDAVNRVGGFKPGLDRSGQSLLGGGETEWIRRAMAAGLELWSAPRAHVLHYVSPKRVETPDYVLGVARGLGESHIYMKDAFPVTEVARQLVGRTGLGLLHAARSALAQLRGDRLGKVDALVGLNLCLGAIAGTVKRLRGVSPVTLTETPAEPLTVPASRGVNAS